MKLAIVYASTSGNTEMMAEAIRDGAQEAGAEVTLIQAMRFDASQLDAYDRIAFGSPSMGSENLEEADFEPMFASLEANLGGKEIALFGSYGWGDGEFMRTWVDRCTANNAILLNEGLIINYTPDADGIEQCKALGRSLA